MYFIVNENDYHGERSAIGDIVSRFSEQLYKETGLSLCLYAGFDGTELKSNTTIILHEEILWKNMTEDEKIGKFVENITKIGGVDGELLIIDPYLFSKSHDAEYVSTLSEILNRVRCTNITVVTDFSNFDEEVCQEVQQAINREIKMLYSSDFHDRYWIANRTKGFLSGTSFNGIGRRISSILMLEQDDVDFIVKKVDAIEEFH